MVTVWEMSFFSGLADAFTDIKVCDLLSINQSRRWSNILFTSLYVAICRTLLEKNSSCWVLWLRTWASGAASASMAQLCHYINCTLICVSCADSGNHTGLGAQCSLNRSALTRERFSACLLHSSTLVLGLVYFPAVPGGLILMVDQG